MKSGAAAEKLDDPVAIKALKRFVADWYFENIAQLPPPNRFRCSTPENSGRGPGLRLLLRYFLAQMGYPVTVFEALLCWRRHAFSAIPDFRLPQEVIDQEINIIRRGVEIRYNSPLISTLPLKT